jgi:hypothetical protein
MPKLKKIRKKKNRRQVIAEKVFEFLKNKSAEFLDLSATIIIDPASDKIAAGSFAPYWRKRGYFSQSPYFERRKDGNYFVTPKGRIRIIKNILKDKLNKQADWSGYWWAVAFDIPEKRKGARDLLRRELKEMHFFEIQKSVWVTPYNIEKELSALSKLWLKDFEGDIRIFKIEKIIDDKDLKELFEIR